MPTQLAQPALGAHEVLPWPFEDGKTVIDDRFRIVEGRGKGGMAFVFQTADQKMGDRKCATKVLGPWMHPKRDPKSDAAERAVREALFLCLLGDKSEYFVRVFDRGTLYIAQPFSRNGKSDLLELDLPYYVMEYLRGANLQEVIAVRKQMQSPMPMSAVLRLAAQAARGLGVAHAEGIIHRDIKPNNLVLHHQHPKVVLKYIDCGISTMHGDPGLMGSSTREYGAPELLRQHQTRPPENKQTDIYPLSLVLYQLAATVHPFESHRRDLVYAHLYLSPPPLSVHRPDAPPGLVALLDAGLAKDPEARPTAVELANGIDALRGEDDAVADAKILEIVSTVRKRAAERPRALSKGGSQAETRPPRKAASELFFAEAESLSSPEEAEPERSPVPAVPTQQSEAARTSDVQRIEGAEAEVRTDPFVPSDCAEDPEARPTASAPKAKPEGARPSQGPFSGAVFADDDEAPVFSSTFGVFAAWQDDTTYLSSPYDREHEDARQTPERRSDDAAPDDAASHGAVHERAPVAPTADRRPKIIPPPSAPSPSPFRARPGPITVSESSRRASKGLSPLAVALIVLWIGASVVLGVAAAVVVHARETSPTKRAAPETAIQTTITKPSETVRPVNSAYAAASTGPAAVTPPPTPSPAAVAQKASRPHAPPAIMRAPPPSPSRALPLPPESPLLGDAEPSPSSRGPAKPPPSASNPNGLDYALRTTISH